MLWKKKNGLNATIVMVKAKFTLTHQDNAQRIGTNAAVDVVIQTPVQSARVRDQY